VVGVLRHRVLARVVQAILAAGRRVLALEGRVEGEVISNPAYHECMECTDLCKSEMLVYEPSLLDIFLTLPIEKGFHASWTCTQRYRSLVRTYYTD
jgi:hypothetical protein